MNDTVYLFLDETGSFNPGDRCAIGGFMAFDAVTPTQVEAFWTHVLGRERGDTVIHAKEKPHKLGEWLGRAAPWMKKTGWRAFMFEHVTGRRIVDNATTYVNVMADGLTKLARELSLRTGKKLRLSVMAAYRSLPDKNEPSELVRMEAALYRGKLQERLDLERLRSPHYANELKWDWEINFASATENPRLMVSDLLCYGWRKMPELDGAASVAAQELMDGNVYPVLQVGDVERIGQLLARDEHGVAVLDLLYMLSATERPSDDLLRCRNEVVQKLSYLDDFYLDAAMKWALERIELGLRRRSLDETDRQVAAFRREILDPLREKLSTDRRAPQRAERLAWAEAHALSLGLTVSNHRGAVMEAEKRLREMAPTRAALSTRFERLPLALQIQFNEAVHWTNTYDFSRCHKKMKDLGMNLLEVVSLLVDVADGVSAESRSDAVGKALGTALQAAMHMGRRDPSWYAEARELSDVAYEQFEQVRDRMQQAGYRCQLEIDSGDLLEGRRWLSLAVTGAEGTELPEIIEKAKADGSGFSLMHVVRLWEAYARGGRRDEARVIERDWKAAGVDDLPRWRKPDHHPWQLDLWKWGSALGYMGCHEKAQELLKQAYQALEAHTLDTTLLTLGLGARCDSLALVCFTDSLGSKTYKRGVKSLRERVVEVVAEGQPEAQRAYFASWLPRIDALEKETKAEVAAKGWRGLAWEVPF